MTSTYVDWPGNSGVYRYWFANMMLPFLAVPGNYAFVQQLPSGLFKPLYFGQTSDLSKRMPGHEVWPQAIRHGGTHVMIHSALNGELLRRAEEIDLIARWNPVLNIHYRTTG